VFYKQFANELDLDNFLNSSAIAYYHKDLPKKEEIIFTFTKDDQVEKVGNS
jgi:hypothetical protein